MVFDLVVGFRGTWSKVRTLLTDQALYLGIAAIALKVGEVDAK